MERQCAFLLGRGALADFLVGVEPFLDVLVAEPQIAPHLDDLRAEAVDIFNAQKAVEEELLPDMRALREDLVQLMPELDDSQREPEPDTGEPPNPLRIDHSLARFDEGVSEEPSPIGPDGSGGRAGELVSILQAKAYQAHRVTEEGGRPKPEGMEDWARRLGNADIRLSPAEVRERSTIARRACWNAE
jgi:predicted metal-dependent enzyme (double-stranded beta helix superfamily)